MTILNVFSASPVSCLLLCLLSHVLVSMSLFPMHNILNELKNHKLGLVVWLLYLSNPVNWMQWKVLHTIFGYFLWFGNNSRTTFVAVVKHQLINKDISAALLQKVTICWTLHTQWFIMTELCWENTLGWVGTIFINIFTFKKLLLTCTNQKTKM